MHDDSTRTKAPARPVGRIAGMALTMSAVVLLAAGCPASGGGGGGGGGYGTVDGETQSEKSADSATDQK
ncbi:hypothetical protein [Nocardiopsis sp. NPDC058789]|uniref:Uncharacterized protein n=1 Tax=Nocardiopsis eucommiae TaxID=2831970 RepID=A0A975QLN5_9ACTN|nr:hypothetical protein KGD82_09450 [Nocardiopsis eucommiae]